MKHIHRFFVDEDLSPGSEAALCDDDSFHAARVLRLRRGDAVEVAGAGGRVFAGEVARVDGGVSLAVADELLDEYIKEEAIVNIAQAIPKGKKMDLIVEKTCELGVARLTPVHTEKSAVKEADSGNGRLARWRRLARAAAGQSRRRRIMAVEDPVRLGELLSGLDEGPIVLATEVEGEPLHEVLKRMNKAVTILVGPEAGFSSGEIEMLRERGAVFAGLGPRPLRTETAAIAAAVLAMQSLGGLG